MSAFCGIYNVDGAPVDERLLAALGSRLDQRGPDGGRNYISDSVGMAYRAFHTTHESRLEVQPIVSVEGAILCWDGRLDNREDLSSMLRDGLRSDHSDAAIVMASYLRWGADFASRIIGDFALSLWDPRNKRLLLARDPIGSRTLYYHENDKYFLWATDLEPLFDLTGADSEINEEYVADALSGFPAPGRSPYKNIHCVPPAYLVITQKGRGKVQRFWRLDPAHQIRYKTDAEYEEHFRCLFREAVRARLRTDSAIWAELGGLDSSSIVCMAHEILKSGQVCVTSFQTVSRIYDQASKSDERKYIQAVEDKIGQRGIYLREDDHRFITPLAEKYSKTFPNLVADFVGEYYEALNEAMQERRARVLLSGEGGDEVGCAIRDPSPELIDLLFQGKWLSLHRLLRNWSKALKTPYLKLLWRMAMAKALQRSTGYSEPHKNVVAAMNRIYDQGFLKGKNLNARRFGLHDDFGFHSYTGRYQSNLFQRAVRLLSAGYYREFMNIEIRYPFMHRPLIEYLQAIPYEQKVRPAETRSIVRRALAGLLPSEVVNRRGKSKTAHAYRYALARESERLHRLFSDPRVCALGYADRGALRQLLAASREGPGSDCSLGLFIPFEYWLQALERRKVSPNPSPAQSGGRCDLEIVAADSN
jgi:asparagine synthase (glutamine-hydrolysing)